MSLSHPSFIIIGAPKSGSTTLYHGLRQHPALFMSAEKEPRYFCYLAVREARGSEPRNPAFFPVRTEDAYRRLFADADGHRTGEASVSYLEIPGTAEVIARHRPDARLIAILRNPVDRAFSHYLMNVRGGDQRRSFEDALADETYLRTGLYTRHLAHYRQHFADDQLFVCLTDDLKQDPLGLLRRIYAFLGVDPAFEPDLSFQHNVGGAPRSRLLNALMTQARLNEWVKRRLPEPAVRWMIRLKRTNYAAVDLPPELRERLADYYRAEVGALGRALDRDLSHWLA